MSAPKQPRADVILVDEPAPRVRRITMNRPEKRNSLIHPLRGAILGTLREHDADPDVSVTIIRGAGPSFSAGYDLGGGNEGYEMPYYTPGGEGAWPRHVTEGWMSIWDLAKPVIAQIHGYCLAGASELATGCDLVYMAEDAQMGYPAVRFGVPDMHFHPWFLGMRKAMEMMLTGDSVSGVEAARRGWANEAFPADELDERGARDRATHRAGADRAAAAQQARRAPADGRDGPAGRHPRRHRALRARHAHRARCASSSPTRARRASPARSRNATPPSATTARPSPTKTDRVDYIDAIATSGDLNAVAAVEPRNSASPKLNTPPSPATSQ